MAAKRLAPCRPEQALQGSDRFGAVMKYRGRTAEQSQCLILLRLQNLAFCDGVLNPASS